MEDNVNKIGPDGTDGWSPFYCQCGASSCTANCGARFVDGACAPTPRPTTSPRPTTPAPTATPLVADDSTIRTAVASRNAGGEAFEVRTSGARQTAFLST